MVGNGRNDESRIIIRAMHALFIFCLLAVSTVQAAPAPEIAVDVGHGVVDRGATSARGRSEFDFNLDFSQVLAPVLRTRGYRVREINFSGDIVRLADRPLKAAGADFFIAIHHDSISEPYLKPWDWDGSEQTHTDLKRGFGIFVSHDNPHPKRSLACASALGTALRAAGFVPSMWHGRKHVPADRDNGVWYYDNLVVLYRTALPAVLFEAGVIKHREEELELRDPERQARMAAALAEGFARCLPGGASGEMSAVTGKPVPE